MKRQRSGPGANTRARKARRVSVPAIIPPPIPMALPFDDFMDIGRPPSARRASTPRTRPHTPRAAGPKNRRRGKGSVGQRARAQRNPAWHRGAGAGVPYYRPVTREEAFAAFQGYAAQRPRAAMKDWGQRSKKMNTTYAYVLHPGRYDYPGIDDGSNYARKRGNPRGGKNPRRLGGYKGARTAFRQWLHI